MLYIVVIHANTVARQSSVWNVKRICLAFIIRYMCASKLTSADLISQAYTFLIKFQLCVA